jgi:NAD-dependent deacetylase
MDFSALAGRLAERLPPGGRLLCITGAGISAESGLPTYRGVGGLYDGVDTALGVPIEVTLSGHMFQRDPALTWRYLAEVEAAARSARPSGAHRALVELERHFAEVVILTQNVDGLHRTAGSRDVIDIHGDCRRLLCTRCPHRVTVETYAGLALPPRCPDCGGVVRPDVVLFGELLPFDKVGRLERELQRGFDAYFSVGTSSVFPYIAGPILEAAARGLPTVEINPVETEVSRAVGFRFAGPAGVALDAVSAALAARWGA